MGPEKSYFAKAPLAEALEALDEAHTLGLRVHPWTMRLLYIGEEAHDNSIYRQEEKYVDEVFNNDPQIEVRVI